MAEASKQRPRLTLTRQQAAYVREWRNHLTSQMQKSYDGMWKLRLKHRERGQLWTVEELKWASLQITKLVRTIEKVLKGWVSKRTSPKTGKTLARYHKGIVEFCEVEDVPAPLRDRICGSPKFGTEEPGTPIKHPGGAFEALVRAVGYFSPILPGNLRERYTLLLEAEQEEVIETYFMVQYLDGMKALRNGVAQLWLVTTVRERNIALDEAESYLWHSTMEEDGEPPEQLVNQWQKWVAKNDEVANVYDDKGEFLFRLVPEEGSAEGAGGPLKAKQASARAKKIRMEWEHKPTAISNMKELNAALDPEARKKLAEIIRSRSARGLPALPIEKLAEKVGVGVTPTEAPARKRWGKVRELEALEPEEKMLENPGSDVASYLTQQQLWSMDLTYRGPGDATPNKRRTRRRRQRA